MSSLSACSIKIQDVLCELRPHYFFNDKSGFIVGNMKIRCSVRILKKKPKTIYFLMWFDLILISEKDIDLCYLMVYH